MDTITIKQFMKEPERYVRDASVGEYVTVSTGAGCKAVIIDEAEWTILVEALRICIDHPEWADNQ